MSNKVPHVVTFQHIGSPLMYTDTASTAVVHIFTIDIPGQIVHEPSVAIGLSLRRQVFQEM